MLSLYDFVKRNEDESRRIWYTFYRDLATIIFQVEKLLNLLWGKKMMHLLFDVLINPK